MIFETILTMIFNVVDVVLAPVSILGWGFSLSLLSPLGDILKVIYYVLPIGKLSPIITFVCATLALRIAISLIKTFKQLLLFG